MKIELTHHLVAALIGVVLTTTLHAQTSAFTYQGRLTDNGSPASGIYDLDTGGSVVAGPITNSLVAISNGPFTVTLDFGTGVFDGSDRWLEIGVATSGSGMFTNLSPRQFNENRRNRWKLEASLAKTKQGRIDRIHRGDRACQPLHPADAPVAI